MYRRYALNLAARSRGKPCMRSVNSCDPPHRLPSSSFSPDFLPILSSSRRQYASRGRGGRGGGRGAGRGGGRGGGRGALTRGDDDDDDDDDEDDDDEDEDELEEEDTPGYEFDYDTWNLLHQGKKEGEQSRKWPLPMYKAREMVDFHMIKNRLDGLKIITDPKLEYEQRKQAHERLVDLYKKTQAAYDEIDALHEKKKLEESARKKEALQITEGEAKTEDSEEKSAVEVASDVKDIEGVVAEGEVDVKDVEGVVVEGEVDGKDVEAREVDAKDVEGVVVEAHVEGGVEAKVEEMHVEGKIEAHAAIDEELKDVAASTLDAQVEGSQGEDSAEGRDLSAITTAVDDIIKDVLSVPEVTTLELGKEMSVETKSEDEALVEDDGVNVFDYDKWVAYREQEVAKRYAEVEERKHATLRWKIQLVLGPGDVVHPANRKASVSVYVRELCLSKYAKQRLLALVGKRYKAPKDELTIVSERYPHRYENQKDVLRTLLALIEEAKKADQLVYDARIGFLKAKNAESTKVATSITVM